MKTISMLTALTVTLSSAALANHPEGHSTGAKFITVEASSETIEARARYSVEPVQQTRGLDPARSYFIHQSMIYEVDTENSKISALIGSIEDVMN